MCIRDSGVITGLHCDRHMLDKIRLSLDDIRMGLKPMLNQKDDVELIIKPVAKFWKGKLEEEKNLSVLEIHVKKGKPNQVYFTSRGQLYVRLLASLRQLTGPSMIQYGKEKEENASKTH
eukprot:TRINITY_DN27947_c0_g1_i1.p2 TRINITY_DN27947_c0_g1~~TRINITY_DN27947_c0_g1_i1.p2  ORF type:complete len:119 (+),score=15.91 TRINITY_DN27947_c0_g1_i1:169-525(+)